MTMWLSFSLVAGTGLHWRVGEVRVLWETGIGN